MISDSDAGSRETRAMTQEGYVKNHLLFYPGARLSPAERQRMETLRHQHRRAHRRSPRLQHEPPDREQLPVVLHGGRGGRRRRDRAGHRQGDRPPVRRPGLRQPAPGPGSRGSRRAPDDGAVPGPRARDPRPEARGRAVRRVRRHPLHRASDASASTSARRTRRTASTPRRSRPGASRGTWPRTRTCCGSRCSTAGSRGPTGCEQHWVFKPPSERLGSAATDVSLSAPACSARAVRHRGRRRRRRASLRACTSRPGRSASSGRSCHLLEEARAP